MDIKQYKSYLLLKYVKKKCSDHVWEALRLCTIPPACLDRRLVRDDIQSEQNRSPSGSSKILSAFWTLAGVASLFETCPLERYPSPCRQGMAFLHVSGLLRWNVHRFIINQTVSVWFKLICLMLFLDYKVFMLFSCHHAIKLFLVNPYPGYLPPSIWSRG